MQVTIIKTCRIQADDSLEKILDEYIPPLQEKTIVIITSKIISLCQGRVVSKDECCKEDLIKEEADTFIEGAHHPNGFYLTIKNNLKSINVFNS